MLLTNKATTQFFFSPPDIDDTLMEQTEYSRWTDKKPIKVVSSLAENPLQTNGTQPPMYVHMFKLQVK